jgi:O-antigen/teichoic acid export membrane protein
MTELVRARMIRSLGATGFSLGSLVLIQLAGVPLFLHGFGVHLYGEWLVLSALPAYLALSDLGFVGVLGNDMTMRLTRDDQEGALAAFQSVFVTITALSGAMGVSCVIALWFVDPRHALSVSLMSHGDVALTLAFLIGNVLVSLQLGLLEAGFRCVGKFPRGNAGISAVRLAALGTSAGVALAGGGPVGASAAQVAATTVGYLGLRVLLRRDAPWLSFGYGAFSRSILGELLPPASSYLCFPIGNALTLQGMVLVVSAQLGPAQVVVVNVVRVATTGIRQLVSVINHAVWPELTRAIVVHDLPLARRLHLNAVRANLVLAIVAAGALMGMGTRIVQLWTRDAVSPDPTFLRLMVLTVICDSAWVTSAVVLLSVNRHQRTAVLYVATSGLAVAVVALCIDRFGLCVIPAALMASGAVLTVYVARAASVVLEQSPRELARKLVGSHDGGL